MKKKVFKFASVVISFSLLFGTLVGCGSQTKKSTEKPKTVKLRLFTRWTGTEPLTPLFQQVQKEFKEKYPNVEIQDESINDGGAYNNKLKADLATGNMPGLFQAGILANLSTYAKNGVVMDMSSTLESDKEWAGGFEKWAFDPFKMDEYGVKGIYGVPYALDYEVFFYNTELFQKAGIQKTPETWDELLEVIKKLKNANITPWVVGGKNTWRMGHIHNAILYRWAGVQKAMDLGVGKAKWTDPEVVESLQFLKDLKDMGAFEPNLEGVDFETEKADFLSGKAAMTLSMTGFIGNVESAKMGDKVKTFVMPYFKEKPQFKGNNVAYRGGFSLNGQLQGAEKEAMINFAKMFTDKVNQTKMATDAKRVPVRKDITIDKSQIPNLLATAIDYAKISDVLGSDSFDYDANPAMIDRTRNSIIGMLLGDSAEKTAQDIQKEKEKK